MKFEEGDVLMSGQRHSNDVIPNNTDFDAISGLSKKVFGRFEKNMTNLGSRISEITVDTLNKISSNIVRLYRKSRKTNVLNSAEVLSSIKAAVVRAAENAVEFAERVINFIGRYSGRVKKYGFAEATRLQASDIASYLRRTKRIYSTIVNYSVPVVAIILLVNVISYTKSIDYGVSVECNGHEIGVISTEDTLNEAQKVIADRVTYYDTGSEVYVSAKLSIKPLSSNDEVLDEIMLADAIENQIPEITEVQSGEDALNAVEAGVTEDLATDKVRAYPVIVDGEMIGAVSDYGKIENTINDIKKQYEDDSVVEVDFDKQLEYGYEQYVDPDEIVDQDEIIDKITGVEAEPVYYEVQLDDTPWDIAMSNDMSVDELKDCTATFNGDIVDDITEDFQVGTMIQLSSEVPYLEPVVKKELTYSQVIDYEIIKNEDDSLYKGDSVVDVKGVEGEKQIHAFITYKNGSVIDVDVIDEKVISEPVTKVMRVGTKQPTTPVSTGSGGSGDYFWPVAGGYISAYFGDGRGHKGIDIAAPYGTPIYAAESGTVTKSSTGWNGGYGNMVTISHNDGNVTVYAHQSSLAVSYGDYVVEGQLIGYIGSTGDSSGNHLHFEVRCNGQYNNPIDYVSQY